jgi:hypothetical protein
MTEDRRRAEDEPVSFDTPIEVEPGVFKPLRECTEEELLVAAGNHAWRVQQEMQQEIDEITADPNE